MVEENNIQQDPTSPSGYSIFKFGKWIHLELPKKKKKKLKPEAKAEAEANDINNKNERDRIEEKNNKHHEEMYQAILDTKRAIVISSGYGYAVVILKRRLMVQKYIENNKFQPYEKVEEKLVHLVSIMRWASQRMSDELVSYLVNSGCSELYFGSAVDIKNWILQEGA